MKFFKEDKWTAWWNSLPENTRIYLESQPIWHDNEVTIFISISIVIGFIIGFFTGYR